MLEFAVVQRDERVEGDELDRPRKAPVLEPQPGDGEASREGVGGEVRHAGERIPPGAEAEIARGVGWEIAGPVAEVRSVENAGVDDRAALFGAHGEMRDAVGHPLGWGG